MKYDIEVLRKIVMEAGALKLDGVFDLFPDEEPLVAFTEPATKSQVTIKLSECTVEGVRMKLEQKRIQFKKGGDSNV